MPCPAHRDGAPLPAGLCAGGGCAGTPQRMSLRWLLGHRSVMLSALWMLRQLKLEIPEATQRPAQVPAGASCWAAALPHCCAGGHAGRAAGAPRLVPAIGNPGLRVRGQPGANHRVTPRAVAAALPSHHTTALPRPAGCSPLVGAIAVPTHPGHATVMGTSLPPAPCAARHGGMLSFSPRPGLSCVVFLFLL